MSWSECELEMKRENKVPEKCESATSLVGRQRRQFVIYSFLAQHAEKIRLLQ